MRAAVVGAGPAGLMAAEVLAQAGVAVTVYEAMPSPARKLLMAGKSGLNLTFTGDFDKVLAGYGDGAEHLRPALEAFDNRALRGWAEGLGVATFEGSTGRVFPEAMKASPLLRAWLARLADLGVDLRRRWRWTGWDGDTLRFETPEGAQSVQADVTVLACGGASWARLGSDGAWAEWLPCAPFQAANVGLLVDWSGHMAPHYGAAVKNVAWSADDLASRGEAVISDQGLEGGGIYPLIPALRQGAALEVDLLPGISAAHIVDRLSAKPHKMTLTRWLARALRLDAAKIALLMEFAGGAALRPTADWAALLKALPIRGAQPGGLARAISVAGGVPFAALNDDYMLCDRPGTFCAGEMLDWEAPTGGWLLTACFATGAWAAQGAYRFLAKTAEQGS